MSIGVTNELTTVGTSQLIDGSVTSAKISAGAVNTAKISSESSPNGAVLTANGSGSASFQPATGFNPMFLTGV